jgi:hypothetical protein
MTKIEGYEDCHMVNENNPASLSPDSPAQPISAGLDSDAQIASMRLHAAPVDAQDGGGESNGGDEPSGDAETVTLGTESMAVQGDCAPSPTYTREELERVLIDANGQASANYEEMVDALIAIGAVRVK